MTDMEKNSLDESHLFHPRMFQGNQLVYPVLSRRSRGISVGINLNPDKLCNFNCLYCQVDRKNGQIPPEFSVDIMSVELQRMLDLITSGDIYNYLSFRNIPEKLRRLNDIALSGDGEPTACQKFLPACEEIVRIKKEMGLNKVKIVLITNASLLHKPDVIRGIKLMYPHNGQIWAKLDAGTEAYYQQVNQSSVPFQRILSNLTITAQYCPIIIQTLFARVRGERPTIYEIKAYAENLQNIISQGGQIDYVQLHTIARKPSSTDVSALSKDELDDIEYEIKSVIDITIEKFYGN